MNDEVVKVTLLGRLSMGAAAAAVAVAEAPAPEVRFAFVFTTFVVAEAGGASAAAAAAAAGTAPPAVVLAAAAAAAPKWLHGSVCVAFGGADEATAAAPSWSHNVAASLLRHIATEARGIVPASLALLSFVSLADCARRRCLCCFCSVTGCVSTSLSLDNVDGENPLFTVVFSVPFILVIRP